MNAPQNPGPPKDPTYERWRKQIFAITWLAYAGFYLTRKSFSVAKIEMGEGTAIGLTSAQMAWIDGAYLTAYAAGQFLWGMAGDRFGTRKVILAGMAVSVVAGFAMGVSTLVNVIGLAFLVQGLCQSTGWAPLAKNFGNFFSQRERGTMMGLWCTNYAVGGLVASIYAGWAAVTFGSYRYAFFVPAGTLAVIWVLFLVFQRNRPEDVGLPSIEQYHGEPEAVIDPDETPDEEVEGTWHVVKEVLTNRMVLLLAAVYLLLKPTRYAILFWGPKYMNEKLGSGMLESGAISALFELAGPLSVLVAGVVSDKIFGSRRMPVSVMCLFGLAALLFFLDDMPVNSWALGGSFFLIGLLLYAPDSLVSGTAAVDFGTKKGASTAAGVINGCGSIGAIVGGTIPGFFKDTWGWDGVFAALSVSVLLAACLLLPRWNALPEGSRKADGGGGEQPPAEGAGAAGPAPDAGA